MTPRAERARAEPASVDCGAARRLLEQAARHMASAAISGVDDESRYGMLYDAGRKACDAILRAAGRRLRHGTGHHAAYLAEARRLLGSDADTTRLLSRLDAARSIRNGTQYRLREVTEAELFDLKAAASDVLSRATEFVRDACA